MNEQASDDDTHPLPQSVIDTISGIDDGEHTLTDTLTSDTEEGGDSLRRSDSLHISRASKAIKRGESVSGSKRGRKKVGGMCSVCS